MNKKSVGKTTKALVGAMLVAATTAAANVAIDRARRGASGQTIPKTAKAGATKKTKTRPTKKRAAKKRVSKKKRR